MANTTLNALNSLADQVPGLNQKALKQVQAARDIGLQKQIQAAPTRQAVQPQAQALATQQALQAGQDIVAQRQQAAGQAQQIRQAALQEKQRLSQQQLQQQELAQQAELERKQQQQLQELRKEELDSRKTILDSELAATTRLQDMGIEQDNKLQMATIKQREDLNRIGLDLKSKLIDSRLQFSKDERGRKFTNERQLADFFTGSAINKQHLNSRLSGMKQSHDRKLLLLKHAHARLEKAIKQEYITKEQKLDFEAKKELVELKAAIDRKIKRESSKAKNKTSMFRTAGTVIGTVAGAIIGGLPTFGVGGAAGAAAGGVVGGAIGGGLGTMASSQSDDDLRPLLTGLPI